MYVYIYIERERERVSLFTEQYNSEMCSSSYDYNFSEFQPELSLFKEFCSILLTLNPSIRMRVIRTIVNSWSAAGRLHGPKNHKCLFCGEWEDDLPHYLNCVFFGV